MTKDIQWPNGIALSLDQKSLYLAVSDGKNPRVAVCNLDGSGLRDVFLAAPLKSKERPGSCDGLKLDVNGNIWTTGPGGVLILSPKASTSAPSSAASPPRTSPGATTAARFTSRPRTGSCA